MVEASIGTIWLLCQRPFVAFTDWVTHIPMPLLQKKIATFGFIGRLEKLRGVGATKIVRKTGVLSCYEPNPSIK